ncbi:DEAD/DEAH box helicase [Desulfosediminicola flagellatus]|uniref:DEAD/DEAH box helicase n=1 Tax=Desulfosediminicola flagellatus TaxID=2569541 RepID=UPI001E461B05|nr:DEAD/DEAH box helicase [Desulfosediminicola flagellatus]
MMKKFIASAGQKIKKFARAGFLGKKKTRDLELENEQLSAPEKKIAPIKEAPVKVEPASTKMKDDAVVPNASDVKAEVSKRPPRKRKPRWTVDNFKVSPREGLSRFHDFELPISVMHGIADLKFEYCTAIQAKALPQVLEGKDLVGKANTGTGKSAVFLIAIFARLLKNREKRTKKGSPRALIIAPTRELVGQIAKDGKKLGQYTGLRIHAVYGGTNYEAQMKAVGDQVIDVIVATPGRLLDFANKNIISFKECNIMVIDEGDRMLDMGFIPDVRRIIGRIPPKEQRQTLLFSATVSDDVKRLAYQWCVKPVYLEAETEQVSVDSIDQKVYLVTTEEKYFVLYNLIKQKTDERIMVFANMKSEVRKLSERLQRDGIECALLSGDVPQSKRESRLERFRAGKVKVLVATDVAGRGIHIEGISYVVNFTLPYEPEDYVHRIGRTGRAGAEGVSISFACEEGAFVLPEIEEYIERSLECTVPPEELLVPPPERAKGAPDPKKAARRPAKGRRPQGSHTSRKPRPQKSKSSE